MACLETVRRHKLTESHRHQLRTWKVGKLNEETISTVFQNFGCDTQDASALQNINWCVCVCVCVCLSVSVCVCV